MPSVLSPSSFVRVVLGAALLLALGSACGGQSSKSADGSNAGAGAVTGSAGSGSGGKAAHAGSSSAAGTGNAAGAPNPGDACSGPATNGADNCLGLFRRWYHDPNTGLCVPFVYGGCGATANNYESLEDCQATCPGGAPNYDACNVASDCVIAANGCCGVCDGPTVSAHDFRAYNKQHAAEASACPNAVACDACPTPEGELTYKYFVPNCVNKECVVEDIRTSDVTACKSDQDCKLRNGSDCCEGCSKNQWLAVRSDGSFEALVCGEGEHICPDCLAMRPSDARVNCSEGHCGIVYLLK